MSDSEWEQLLSSSPRDAYEYLIEQYGNLIYAIVLNKLSGFGTREDIEDCVSDIMVEFLRNAGKFSAENGSLKSYIAPSQSTGLSTLSDGLRVIIKFHLIPTKII